LLTARLKLTREKNTRNAAEREIADNGIPIIIGIIVKKKKKEMNEFTLYAD